MLEKIENRMVVDSEWDFLERPIQKGTEEKLRGAGYEEIGTGIFVPAKDAFRYALERCLEAVPTNIHEINWTKEFKEMLEGWYFSGNWVWEDGDGAD